MPDWLTLVLLGACVAAGVPPNLARQGALSASSSATEFGGKYGPPKAADGNLRTHWASRDQYPLPQWFEVRWEEPQTVDTVIVSLYVQPGLYDAWREWEVNFSEGEPLQGELEPHESEILLRFPPRRTTLVRVQVLSTYTRSHYVGIDELVVAFDPQRRLTGPPRLPRPLPREALQAQGRTRHPTVYLTPEDVERAKRNLARYPWARQVRENILAEAAQWLREGEEYWLRFLPGPGACYAYGITGCPLCGARWGTWGGARCSWDNPGHVTCPNGHLLPDAEHPDEGTGYRGPDGRVHYFVGSWNAWVTEQWTRWAIPSLARAYALTGEEKYAERAAFFLDALASIYPESTSGSWDYPSRPPSGRFARPWYQVARNLVVFVEAYDLIYQSAALDKPSRRPQLEKTWPPPPWPQTVAVGTPEAHGQSWPNMTRRENIDLNLMQDAAYYCYTHTFGGRLHNGHADYLRGALAVGCLLGIPEYVRWATRGPYSIYAMLDNNVDRDGRYYETSLMYGHHTRSLYLTFAEPLRNWRDEQHPRGIDLYRETRFRQFYLLPDSVLDCAGHRPNFGDMGPDDKFALPREPRFSSTDYALAERLYAGASDPADKRLFAAILQYLSGGDLERVRAGSNLGSWLLFHAKDLPPDTPDLPPDLRRKMYRSWFLGQKGLVLLRTGEGEGTQAALLRYGPSLNHADYDELGLLYYAYGRQLIYDLGYGFGSTHTHVGWASQTASHNLVVVNEISQLKAAGSGGSLYLFVAVPGLQMAEASAENCYRSEGVSLYRRTVVLLGGSMGLEAPIPNPRGAYLVDIFRVVGGQQHDYFLGAQTQKYEVEGVRLGPEEPGSLAGPEISWGTKLGNDGDVIGYPNKPYWNPPPGNGYGFFYGVRRGRPKGAWQVTWPLEGPLETHFRVHFLPPPNSEALLAQAPGLYPYNRKASYAIVRRRGEEPLRSTFVTVMEPYARPTPPGLIEAAQLEQQVTGANAEVKPIPSLRIVLLKGTQAGHRMTFALNVPAAGEYLVGVNVLKANSYGLAQFLLDGKPMGEPVDAWAPRIEGPELIVLGRRRLSAGVHQFTVEMKEPNREPKHYYLGLAGVLLQPAGEADSLWARPFLRRVERVDCSVAEEVEFEPVGLKITSADGYVEYLFSGGLRDGRKVFATDHGPVEVGGALAYLRLAPDGTIVRAVLHGADLLRLDEWSLQAETRAYEGPVLRVDEEHLAVYTPVRLPADGRLNGQLIYFLNDAYSRTTAYRLERVEAGPEGSILHFGDTTFLLGRGHVLSIPDEHTLLSDIPHEYACSLGRHPNDYFFDGKLVTNGRGAATRLTAVEFGTPMTLRVESSQGFAVGDTLFYHDLQAGDRFVLPTTTVFPASPPPSP